MCCFLLTFMFSDEKLPSLELFLLYTSGVISLLLISRLFRHRIMICIGIDFYGFILLGVYSTSWIHRCICCQIWEILSYYFFEYFFSPTFFLLSFWCSDDVNVRFCYSPTRPWGSLQFFSHCMLLLFRLALQIHWFFSLSSSFWYWSYSLSCLDFLAIVFFQF